MRFKAFIEEELKRGVITAYNPHGERQNPDANRAANRQLAQDLKDRRVKPATGEFAGNPERSFSIPKIAKGDLLALGKRYGQQAVAWDGKVLKTTLQGPKQDV